MLSEISQSQKNKILYDSLTRGIKNSRTHRSTRVESWLPGVEDWRKWADVGQKALSFS